MIPNLQTKLDVEPVIVEEPAGFSYVCTKCDIHGYLDHGKPRICWCCKTGTNIEHRKL